MPSTFFPAKYCSFIVAMSENRVIGINNSMPWHLPNDLAFFKTHTLNKPIIMGKNTWLSIGRVLPQRTNVVISRSKLDLPESVYQFSTLSDAIEALPSQELMIIGGAQLFTAAMPYVSKVYLTHVHAHIEGDIYMPALELTTPLWQRDFTQKHEKDAQHAFPFTFEIWQRSLFIPL